MGNSKVACNSSKMRQSLRICGGWQARGIAVSCAGTGAGAKSGTTSVPNNTL